MSVEPSDSVSQGWTRWQGHVINAVFPLGRCIGYSDHSGVFLTESAALGSASVAIKLVPTNRVLAESQLPRWKRAGGLVHPHLLRMWEWGGCQLEGLPHLYALMEYADQTLAQLLLHRALTESEAREMLPPALDALAYLHGRGLVQGRLKPANVLVVGDQLKLASDTICRFGEGAIGTSTSTVYDPPEGGRTGSSAAGDIWALGVTLFEALTRRAPPALGVSDKLITLPGDFCPAFRDVVARCLSRDPGDRPDLAELLAWARGQTAASVPAAASAPAAAAPTALAAPEAMMPPPPPPPSQSLPPSPVFPQHPAEAVPSAPTARTSKARALSIGLLAALVIIALGWGGAHLSRTGRARPPPLAIRSHGGSPLLISHTAVDAAKSPAPVTAVAASSTAPTRSPPITPPLSLQQVIPDVPQSARRTIRGHIQVWVRVVVDPEGSVQSAVTVLPGPSRYFRRLALEAARQWTFPPSAISGSRLLQIRFDFSRDGTTGRAVTVH